MRVARTVTLRGAVGAELRTGRYLDRDYLVVPVVALMEGVIQAANSDTPELVLASELEKAPAGWNGRPCVLNHPRRDGQYVSAGDPTVLEEYGFGLLFGAHVKDKRLCVEAWLDAGRADAVGPKATRTMEMLRAGDPVEVSTGTLIEVEPLSGVYEPTGQAYAGVWRGLVPDHLAFLEEGATGACSVEMGCGAPRAAVTYLVTAAGLKPIVATAKESAMPDIPAAAPAAATTPAATPPAPADAPRSLRDRLLALVGVKAKDGEPSALRPDFVSAVMQAMRADEGVSDVDLRNGLDRALRSTEPGYMWIEAVFPTDRAVVYCVAPEDRMVTVRRAFTVADDGAVTLAEAREEVKAVTNYEPVKAAAAQAAAAGCGCKDKKAAPAAAGEGTMAEPTKKARVQALVDSKKNPYTAANAARLEALDDVALKAIEELEKDLAEPTAAPVSVPAADATAAPAATPAPVAAAAPDTTATPAKVKTAEEIEAEYLAGAPESIRTMVAAKKAADAAEKAALVAGLKAAQTTFTEPQLLAKPNDELRSLAAMVESISGQAVVASDYSGRALPRAADATTEPPDGYQIAIAARKAASTLKGKES